MKINALNDFILKQLEDSKAIDIVSLDVHKLTSVTDYMFICSGRSERHVQAIAEKLAHECKINGSPPLSITGRQTGKWVLVDLNTAIVHVMLGETRDYYELEKLWRTATETATS